MANVNIFLNFTNTTEAAFAFYKSVFGGEFTGGIHRFREAPPATGMPPISEADKNLVMHVELPILGGHKLMGCDSPASMGFKIIEGNNFHINLEPDTRREADRLFNTLSAGGKIGMPLKDMFWGAYYGSLTDKFGVRWMINCVAK